MSPEADSRILCNISLDHILTYSRGHPLRDVAGRACLRRFRLLVQCFQCTGYRRGVEIVRQAFNPSMYYVTSTSFVVEGLLL